MIQSAKLQIYKLLFIWNLYKQLYILLICPASTRWQRMLNAGYQFSIWFFTSSFTLSLSVYYVSTSWMTRAFFYPLSLYVDAKSCGVESLTQIYIKRWLGSFIKFSKLSLPLSLCECVWEKEWVCVCLWCCCG